MLRAQITLATRDVFIECTATDLAKARVVLNTLVAMFSEYCAAPFEVEPVEVVDAFGASHGAQKEDCACMHTCMHAAAAQWHVHLSVPPYLFQQKPGAAQPARC